MPLRLADLRHALSTPEGPDPLTLRGTQRGRASLETPSPPALAAVAAVLTGPLELLFIQRATRPGDPWSGHISFPGGRAEPTDPDTLATAVRETREELGLDLRGAEVLGALDDVPTAPDLPSLIVRPWVFWADSLPRPTPNHEVAEVLRVPLQHLAEGRGRGMFTHTWRGHPIDLPYVALGDGARLWGMTLRMVDDLLIRTQATREPER